VTRLRPAVAAASSAARLDPGSGGITSEGEDSSGKDNTMTQRRDGDGSKPRLVGINHVALEVGDIEAALAFYGKIFEFTLRGRGKGSAFIDMGDQFLALQQTSHRAPAGERHFGLVVDDRSQVRALVAAAGGELLPGPFLDFLDPWGNRVEVVDYADIQFTKAPHVLRGMGLALEKNAKARRELAEKGMGEVSP
jgi:predicted enzyme related to lactoylglutathione lyase